VPRKDLSQSLHLFTLGLEIPKKASAMLNVMRQTRRSAAFVTPPEFYSVKSGASSTEPYFSKIVSTSSFKE